METYGRTGRDIQTQSLQLVPLIKYDIVVFSKQITASADSGLIKAGVLGGNAPSELHRRLKLPEYLLSITAAQTHSVDWCETGSLI